MIINVQIKLSLYWKYICGISDNASNMDEAKWHEGLWTTIFNPKKAIKIITNIVVRLYSYCSSIHLYLYGHKYCSEQKIIDFSETLRAESNREVMKVECMAGASGSFLLVPVSTNRVPAPGYGLRSAPKKPTPLLLLFVASTALYRSTGPRNTATACLL